jgi:hypothetical protein
MTLLQKLVYVCSIQPRMNKLKKLLPEASIYPTGSRYVCHPPVLVTDVDFIVYHPYDVPFVAGLLAGGYKYSNHPEYHCSDAQNNVFYSYRKGVENLIVTSDRDFADEYRVATDICKRWNLRQKYDRVTVHEIVRGNGYAGDASECSPDLKKLLDKFAYRFVSPHRKTLIKAYMAQHGMMPT